MSNSTEVATIDRVANPFASSPVVAAPTASANALAQREVAEVQAAMIVARANPRDTVKAVDRILNSFSRPTLAEKAEYQYARGGQDITGLSIRAAEELARQWGNMLSGVAELSRSHGVSECMAYAWDLETNYRDEKRFQVRHWRDTKKGGYPITEERDIYELIANMGSRRKRACILSVIPGDVQEVAQQQAQATLSLNVEMTPERVKSMLDKFAGLDVTHSMIEKRIQRRIDAMVPAQFQQLGKIYNSIKDGMSVATDWFEPQAAAPAAEPAAQAATGSKTAGLKDRLRAGQKPEPAKQEQEPPAYSVPSAIEAIRKARTLEELGEVYADIRSDFKARQAELPIDIEAAQHDRREAIQERDQERE